MVLLHGGWLDLRQWDEQMAALTREHFVLRYDARGYGRTPIGTQPYAHHDDLAALVREVGIERAHLVALSNGGAISIDFALAYPEMVRSLAVGAFPMRGFDMGAEFTEGMRGVVSAGAADDRERCRQRLWAFEPLLVARTMPAVKARLDRMIVDEHRFSAARPGAPQRILLEPMASSRLGEIHTPTLVVVGEGEMPALLRQADFLVTGIPNARKVVIEGAGHIVNMERPAEYTRVILDWLRQVA